MELVQVSATIKELRKGSRVLATFTAMGKKRLVEVQADDRHGFPHTRTVPLALDEITTASEADALRQAVLAGDYDS